MSPAIVNVNLRRAPEHVPTAMARVSDLRRACAMSAYILKKIVPDTTSMRIVPDLQYRYTVCIEGVGKEAVAAACTRPVRTRLVRRLRVCVQQAVGGLVRCAAALRDSRVRARGALESGVPNGGTGFEAAAEGAVAAAAERVAVAGSWPGGDRGPCANLSSRAHRLRQKHSVLDWSGNFQGERRGNIPRCAAHSSPSSHAASHLISVRCHRR
jgi:hypothetical protein